MPPEFLPTHHRSLRLQNFTAFADATFEFVPGVNALVGENGTGKTHALKALYNFVRSSDERSGPVPFAGIGSLFDSYGKAQLARFGKGRPIIRTEDLDLILHENGSSMAKGDAMPNPQAVFIPATDMIGHTQGFLALERDFRIDFDRTYGDIVAKLELTTKNQSDPLAVVEMATLQDRMGGTVEYDAGERRFYLATPEGRIAMPLVAEGLRKFATLHTIWKNGWLRPGTCLFWDEPEANLNPSLMDEIVAAILALARGGVQVFLATHSYVILKELEVQTTADDAVRFFALEKTEDGTKVHPADRYLDLKPNLIEDQYASLFERTVARRLREQAERV